MYLANEVYSVSLLPHVSLDGVPWQNWFGEAGLDGLHFGGVVAAELPHDVPRGDTKRTHAVQNRVLESFE